MEKVKLNGKEIEVLKNFNNKGFKRVIAFEEVYRDEVSNGGIFRCLNFTSNNFSHIKEVMDGNFKKLEINKPYNIKELIEQNESGDRTMKEKLLKAICQALDLEAGDKFILCAKDGSKIGVYDVDNIYPEENSPIGYIIDNILEGATIEKLARLTNDEIEFLKKLKGFGVNEIEKQGYNMFCIGLDGCQFMRLFLRNYEEEFNKELNFERLEADRLYKIDELL